MKRNVITCDIGMTDGLANALATAEDGKIVVVPRDSRPPVTLADRCIYAHDHMAMKRCRHGTFLYNHNDTVLGRSLDRYGEWAEGEISLLSSFLQPGDVVVDAGANIGTHTIPFSHIVGETGTVIAFEPQRLVFQNLCANLTLNAVTNVRAFQEGLGGAPTTVLLPTCDPRTSLNFAALPMQGWEVGEPVNIVRLDDLLLSRCNLIKIDVEGMECDVLAGAAATINRHLPVLFVENNTERRSGDIIESVLSHGYRAYWHFCRHDTDNILPGLMPNVNMLCLPIGHEAAIDLEMVTGPNDNWRKAVDRSGFQG